MSSQVSALKRIITKEDHNKYSVILLRNTTNCPQNQLVIGRDNDCNYRITSIEISRKHACIKFDDNNWHITDLQSTNGLFINGIQLKPYTPYCLINGDKISFGPQTHSEFIYQFVTDYNLEIHRLNIPAITASLPLIPIRIHTSSCGDSSSSSSSSLTVSPPLPTNTVRFNIEPHVSGTISVTAMPTRSGANYHSTGSATSSSNSNTNSNSNSSKKERKVVKHETVNNRALVNDHEYSRSAVFIPSSGSANKRSAKNKSKEKQQEMEKKRYEREMEKLRKEKEALELKKDSERQRIKRKEEGLKRWKQELDKKEKETKKKEEEIEKIKKQLTNEHKKLIEERNKRKEDKETRNSNSNKKLSTKRKVCDNTSIIECKSNGAKRQCNDVIDTNPEQQLEEIFDSELTCTICHELFVHAVNLNCSHTFCFACIEQWKHSNSGKKECPICRVEIKNQNRQLVLDNLIDRIVNKMKPEQRGHREKLVEERKKKLVKQQQHVSRRLSSNRGVVSSYPLSSLHVILREATNASTSTESDSDSNSDVSSNDEVSVIGIGFAGNYDIQSIESDSDVSPSSAYDSDDSDSDSIAHQSNASNHFTDDSSIVSFDDDVDGDDDDDAQSLVSLSSIAETSDISDSSDESDNESDVESIFHIYDSTDVASVNSSLNSIFTSV